MHPLNIPKYVFIHELIEIWHDEKISGGHVCFYMFLTFRASNNMEIEKLSCYVPHYLVGLGKRNTYISDMILFGGYLRQERHSKG